MASYFGEIIEPFSRALFDDFSDEENSSDEPKLQLIWAEGQEKLSSVLDVTFIIEGRLSLAFAETFLLNENVSRAAEIKIIRSQSDSDRDFDGYLRKTLPSRIYIEDNKAICLVSPSVSPDLEFCFVETILPLLKVSKKVVVFTNDSLHNYKTLSLHELPPAFIKELKTSYALHKNVVEPLETPNFITGISGAVVSWCQIFKKDAAAFVCYTDQQRLDSITASPYLSVIQKLNYNILKTATPNYIKRTFYGNPGVIGGSSNIYM